VVDLGSIDFEIGCFRHFKVDVKTERLLEERKESRKYLATEHVAIANNPDTLFLFVDSEARILIAPTL